MTEIVGAFLSLLGTLLALLGLCGVIAGALAFAIWNFTPRPPKP
jgi:hypothetical protein